MDKEIDEQNDKLFANSIKEELLEYINKNMGFGEKNQKRESRYFTRDMRDLDIAVILQDRKTVLDLTNKFFEEKGLETKAQLFKDGLFTEVIALAFSDWGVDIKILGKNKRSVRNLKEMYKSYPELDEIVNTIIAMKITIAKIRTNKYKIYGVQSGKRRRKRLFKEHEINRVDLSRILGPSLDLMVLSFRNFRLLSNHPIECKLGVDKASEIMIVQFHLNEEDNK